MLYHVIILHLITPHDLAQTAQTPHILLFVHYIHCTYTLRNPNPNTEAMNDCNVIKLMLFDRCIQNFKCEEDDEYQEKPSRIFSFSKAIVIQLAYQKKMIVCLCLLETVVSWYQALRVVPSYILSRSQPFRYAFYNMYQRMFGGLRVGRLLC